MMLFGWCCQVAGISCKDLEGGMDFLHISILIQRVPSISVNRRRPLAIPSSSRPNGQDPRGSKWDGFNAHKPSAAGINKSKPVTVAKSECNGQKGIGS